MDEQTAATKIRACIERLNRYDPDVTVERVAKMLESGRAFLHLYDDGFAVLSTGSNNLHIWIACAFSGFADDLINSFTDIIKIAEVLELPKITFGSDRKGWSRVAHKLGFELKGDQYVRSVV